MRGRLRFRTKVSYGVGQVAEGLKNGALAYFLLFYYSQVLGMSPGWAGAAVGTSVIIDAITDPMAGSISDNWRSRFGRRHPFMYVSALPLGVTFFLLFHPLVTGDLALLIWLIVFTNLVRTAMTLYHVPHIALGAEITGDYDERSTVVSYRTFMGSFGYLLAIFIGFGIFFGETAAFESGQLDAAAYPPMALTVALLMVVTIFWSALGTRHLIPYLPKAPEGVSLRPLAAVLRMAADVALAVRSRSFRWLFLGVLILFVIIGVDAALNIYMYTYFWELSGAEIALLAPMYWLGVMGGTLFSPWLQRVFGKKAMLLFGTASWAFWQMLPVVLRLLGWFPDNDAYLLVPLLAAMRIFQGLCTVQSNVAYGSMMADVIDEHELNTGKRQEGIFFAASSFSAKAPVGLGTIIAGFGLELIDWPIGAHVRTAADVAPETIVHLGILYGPFVAGFGLVCVWCYTHYDLSRARHDEILEELARRHGGVTHHETGPLRDETYRMKARVLRATGLIALIGICCGIQPFQAAAASAASPEANGTGRAEVPDGAALYAARCASCHDEPNDRAPARNVIAGNTPAFIYVAMSKGIMQPMSLGLSDEQKRAIALYLSPIEGERGSAGDPDAHAIWGPSSAEMPLAGPRCDGPPPPIDLGAASQWNGWGPDPDNDRYQTRPGLTAEEVPRLKVKWVFEYPGSKNGQATVIGERLFVTSMSGAVYSLDAGTGCVYWRHDAGSPTRSSVSIGALPEGSGAGYAVYFSDWSKSAVALDASTGEQLWKTRIEAAAGVQMTGAPTLWHGVLLVPISTGNEAFAANDDYECCRFIGSLVALDAATGDILWKRYTTDQPNLPYRLNAEGQQMWGPAGGSIWSAPTIDPERGLVYVSTSNSHTDMPHDGSNAVIAIDIESGAVVWKNQVWPNDNYIIGCPDGANCPKVVGPDFALGAAPILHTQANGRQLILAGQKSGILWALDPADNGKVVWKTRLSPGSALGGIEFGPAADADKVYVGISDVLLREAGKPGLYALRVADGSIVWEAPSPRLSCRWSSWFCHPAISQAVTVIPGVVFAGAMNGRFRAYDADTGEVIWEHDTGSAAMTSVLGETVHGGVMDGAGPTVAGGMVYVHSGYGGRQSTNRQQPADREGNVLIAYSVDGK